MDAEVEFKGVGRRTFWGKVIFLPRSLTAKLDILVTQIRVLSERNVQFGPRHNKE